MTVLHRFHNRYDLNEFASYPVVWHTPFKECGGTPEPFAHSKTACPLDKAPKDRIIP